MGVSPMAYRVPSPGLVWDGCNVEERPRCCESAEMLACCMFGFLSMPGMAQGLWGMVIPLLENPG